MTLKHLIQITTIAVPVVLTAACFKSKSGSSLRDFDAPFSAATLTIADTKWHVALGDAGTDQTYSVSEVTEVTLADAATATTVQSENSGTDKKVVTFKPNNPLYTFKFNVRETNGSKTASCWTTYPAMLGYTVNSPFLKCDRNLNEQPQETDPPQQDSNWDQKIIDQIVAYDQAISFVLSFYGEQIDIDTKDKWYQIENDVKNFVQVQYNGDASTGIEELARKVADYNLSGTVDYNFAAKLNDIYKTAPPPVPPPVAKKCECDANKCSDTFCSSTVERVTIDTATTQSQCLALNNTTVENVTWDLEFPHLSYINCQFK